MQDTGNALEIRRPATENSLLTYRPQYQSITATTSQNCTIDEHTQKRKSDPNTTRKAVITSRKGEPKRQGRKDIQRQVRSRWQSVRT